MHVAKMVPASYTLPLQNVPDPLPIQHIQLDEISVCYVQNEFITVY